MGCKVSKRLLAATGFLTGLLLSITNSNALSLREAISIAVDSNPEIGEAVANREAIEFELRQGKGLFRPRVDIEGSIGAQNRNSVTTTILGDDDAVFLRREIGLIIRQPIFDGFSSRAEVERQASRVDGASHRVFERSEFVALAVVREYADIVRLSKILAVLRENVDYHKRLVSQIRDGVQQGSLSVADQQQALERLYASQSRIDETEEQIKAARARFVRLVGRSVGRTQNIPSVRRFTPNNLGAALGAARRSHPTIKFAQAEIDENMALLKAAESRFYPQFSFEGRARAGEDLEGFEGTDTDLQANLVLSWNIYNGGIDVANRQEQLRRIDESRMRLHRLTRELDEAVRLSWDRREEQSQRLRDLRQQEATIKRLISSYADQFGIGQRSLLDLLDTQNTLVSARLSVLTAEGAVKFSDYRILAATGMLLKSLDIKPRNAADAYAREHERVPPTPRAEKQKRYTPPPRGPKLGPLY